MRNLITRNSDFEIFALQVANCSSKLGYWFFMQAINAQTEIIGKK